MRSAMLVLVLLAAAPARADDPPRATGPWSLAFAGGLLIPLGGMADTTQPGLDVGARVGWSAANGLGLQLGLEYAPLREHAGTAQLYAGTLGPRLTLGHDVFRLWLAGAGGVLLRGTGSLESTATVNGLAGIDLHVFGNGGFTFAGAYTRGLQDAATQYVSVTAGLLFTM